MDSYDHNVTIGHAMPKVYWMIVDQNKQVHKGESGELWLGGDQVMLGYVNNLEKTQEALINFEGPLYYRTGDIAFEDEKGQVYITGRMDDTIKYKGYRINLLDIDSYVGKLAFVKDSVTVAIPDEISENKTICFLICSEKFKVSEIKKQMKKYLLDY